MELPISGPSSRRETRWRSGFFPVVTAAELGLLAFVMTTRDGDAASRTRFWNLTTGTIKEFRLAPSGSANFGKNQCENDPDATVDHDERLDVTEVGTGRYDARIVYASGKACLARGIEVKEGKVFSIDDHDLVDCK